MTKSILFLCTGNSARSIMAEAYMNKTGAPVWRAYSAGSKPVGRPNLFALETLAAHGVPAPGARSKSWDEFSGAGAPPLDVVVTVCDSAAGETCPVFFARGGASPRRFHWSFPDPAAAGGPDADKRAAFETVFAAIRQRIDAFLAKGG
jgi:arsenate reductase